MGKDGGGGGAEPTYYYRGPSQSEYDKLQSERDQLKARVVALEEDLSVNRQCYYEVVEQRNQFFERAKKLEVLVREVMNTRDGFHDWLTRARELVGEG